jgi:predicted DNA-binding transcriptional regulator AlpA
VICVGVKGRLYTTGDIADRLGVGRQRAYVLSRTRGFPEPYDEWEGGLAVWRIEDVEAWIRTSRYAEDPETD